MVGVGTAGLSFGIALFACGDLLRRRQRLRVAQSLLALGGSLGIGFAGVLTAAAFGSLGRGALSCPAVLGLLFTSPVIWHAARAALRSRPTAWPTGFGPIVHAVPLPVKPLAAQDDAHLRGRIEREAPPRPLPPGDDDDRHLQDRPAASRPAAPPEGDA